MPTPEPKTEQELLASLTPTDRSVRRRAFSALLREVLAAQKGAN